MPAGGVASCGQPGVGMSLDVITCHLCSCQSMLGTACHHPCLPDMTLERAQQEVFYSPLSRCLRSVLSTLPPSASPSFIRVSSLYSSLQQSDSPARCLWCSGTSDDFHMLRQSGPTAHRRSPHTFPRARSCALKIFHLGAVESIRWTFLHPPRSHFSNRADIGQSLIS